MKRIGLLLLIAFLSIALCLPFAAQEYPELPEHPETIRQATVFSEEEKALLDSITPEVDENSAIRVYNNDGFAGEYVPGLFHNPWTGTPESWEEYHKTVEKFPGSIDPIMYILYTNRHGMYYYGLDPDGNYSNDSFDFSSLFYRVMKKTPDIAYHVDDLLKSEGLDVACKEIYCVAGETNGVCLYCVTDQGDYVFYHPSFWFSTAEELGTWYFLTSEQFQETGAAIRAYFAEKAKHAYAPDGMGTAGGGDVDHSLVESLSAYRIDAAAVIQAAQSVSAESGEEPKDSAPVGAPQTPADAVLTTGEAPESSNALLWIFGGAGAAVLAAAVVGWIWIRTRKRNESR